jgi:hypothetical protein
MEFILKAFVMLILVVIVLMYLYTRPITTGRRRKRGRR